MGVCAPTAQNRVAEITLPIEFADSNYIVTTGYANSAGAKSVADYGCMGGKTTTYFQHYQYWDVYINWKAEGFKK